MKTVVKLSSPVALTPVFLETDTILLGHIVRVQEQQSNGMKEQYPAEVVLIDGTTVDVPLTVDQVTERMYRRAADFARMLRG